MKINVHSLAKEVAQEALDTIVYEGKTFRQWIEIVSSTSMKHGAWQECAGTYTCSNCGGQYEKFDRMGYMNGDYDYCPHCGAKMDEEG